MRPWCRDSGIRFDLDPESVAELDLESISRTGLSAAGSEERSCTLLLPRICTKRLPPVVRGRDQTVSTEESPERPSRASRRRANTPQRFKNRHQSRVGTPTDSGPDAAARLVQRRRRETAVRRQARNLADELGNEDYHETFVRDGIPGVA